MIGRLREEVRHLCYELYHHTRGISMYKIAICDDCREALREIEKSASEIH